VSSRGPYLDVVRGGSLESEAEVDPRHAGSSEAMISWCIFGVPFRTAQTLGALVGSSPRAGARSQQMIRRKPDSVAIDQAEITDIILGRAFAGGFRFGMLHETWSAFDRRLRDGRNAFEKSTTEICIERLVEASWIAPQGG
jgi:hypothetical protein